MVKLNIVKFSSGSFGVMREVSVFGIVISRGFLSSGGGCWFGKDAPELVARYSSYGHAKYALEKMDLTYKVIK